MSMPDALRSAFTIGHGPSTPTVLTRVVMVILGAFLVFGAFSLSTRLGRTRHGTTLPIGSAGRLILFTAAVVMFLAALGILR